MSQQNRTSQIGYRVTLKIAALVFSFAILDLRFAIPSFGSSGTEGAAFLEIPVGAGPAAVGSAYSARAHDAYAPVWNPAGLGFLDGMQAAAQHLDYLESIHYEFASFVYPLKGNQGLGGSIQYLGSGDVTGRDPTGALTGDFTAHYAAYSLAYGYRFTPQLAAGVSGKFIDANLDDTSAHAYAADFGLLYRPLDKLDFAFTANNLGNDLKFESQNDALPRELHLSAATRPIKQLVASLETVYSFSSGQSVRTGLEWQPIEPIALRVGYRTETIKGLSGLAGFATGLGVHVWGQELDYSWLPQGDLGNTQYISFLLNFGAPAEGRRNLIQYNSIKRHRTVKNDGSPNTVEPEDEDNQQLMELLKDDNPAEGSALAPLVK